MMKNDENKFNARYTVADGYANSGGRPHYFKISAEDLEDDMDERDLERFYEEEVQQHFEQHITPESDHVAEFIEWAKERIAARAALSEKP